MVGNNHAMTTNKDIKTLPERKVIRLQGYDDSLPGSYFVTIVTQNRQCLFGSIAQGQRLPNAAGRVVEKALEQLPEVHKDVTLPSYVVMPNHIHFIVSLSGNVSLHEVVRRFKSETTHQYIEGVKHQGWKPFTQKLWQHNYYEHIIRNQHSFDYISNYITTNPQRWNKDAINPLHDADKDEIMKQVIMYE